MIEDEAKNNPSQGPLTLFRGFKMTVIKLVENLSKKTAALTVAENVVVVAERMCLNTTYGNEVELVDHMNGKVENSRLGFV